MDLSQLDSIQYYNKVYLEDDSDTSDSDIDDNIIQKYIIRSIYDNPEINKKRRGGSYPGKRRNIDRNFPEADARLESLYFSEDSRFDDETFERRFRMPKQMFIDIVERLKQYRIIGNDNK